MKKHTPTNEQLDALGNFAANEGRTWKAALRHAWETGDYPTGSDSASLQQVRNAFGPGWLIGFKVRPVGSKYTASDMGCALGVIAEMEQPSVIDMLAAHAPEATRPVTHYPSFERFEQEHQTLDRPA